MNIKSYILIPIFSFSVNAQAFKVIIDPGHGGKDNGAVVKSLKEASLTMKMANKLNELLQAHPEITTVMTRTSNKSLTLKERALIAKRAQGDLYISIHANSSPDHRAKGAEFFFQNQLPPDYESMFLASREHHHTDENEEYVKISPRHKNKYVESILEDLVRNSNIHQSSKFARALVSKWEGQKKQKRHVVRQAPFYVISNVPMPSVLVELGFLTHKREVRMLKKAAYQNKLAHSLYNGILKYKDSIDNTLN